jgi:predicted DNA-binding protein
MKRSLDIPDDLYKRLIDMAKIKGITPAALIKLACSEYLQKEEQKK